MKHLLSLALLTASAAVLPAQSEQTIIDRAQQPGAPARPDTPAGTTVNSADVDSGTQRIAEPRKLPFKLNVVYDGQFYLANNIRLAAPGTGSADAVVFASTLAARADFKSWAPGNGLLTPSVGLVYQRFFHGVGENRFKDLDFASYSLPISLRYRFGANWEASASFTTTGVYNLSDNHQIFRSYSPAVGINKLISLGQNQLISLGAGISFSATQSDRDGTPAGFTAFRDDRSDKWDGSLNAAYYYMRDAWTFSAYGTLIYSSYLHYQESNIAPLAATNVDRLDITGSIGLNASYTLTPWATARIFTSIDWRNPQGDNQPVDYGYHNTNLGLGITLSANY
jgi:hypothetical protein